MPDEVRDYDTKINELPKPELEGHDFQGWFLGDHQVQEPYHVLKEVTLKAKWTLKQHTVTFNFNNESMQAKVTNGEKAIEPAPVPKEDNEFIGWFKGAELFDFNTPITAPITLVAKWALNEYQVEFSSENLESEFRTVKHGSLALKPDNPVREGYAFENWYLDDQVFDFSTPITAPIKLVAKWKDTRVILKASAASQAAINNNEAATQLNKLTNIGSMERNNEILLIGLDVKTYPNQEALDAEIATIYPEGHNHILFTSLKVVESIKVTLNAEAHEEIPALTTFSIKKESKLTANQLYNIGKYYNVADIKWNLNNELFNFDAEIVEDIELKAKFYIQIVFNHNNHDFDSVLLPYKSSFATFLAHI